MSSNFGSSGSPFDQIELFTFEAAARALVFERTGQIVPALANRLTALGNEFHDWIAVLKDAVDADENPLHVSVRCEEDWQKCGLKACVITREHLSDWCKGRGMRPKFLTAAQETTAPPANETPEERKDRLQKRATELGGRNSNGALLPGILDKLAKEEGVSKTRIKQLLAKSVVTPVAQTSIARQLKAINAKQG